MDILQENKAAIKVPTAGDPYGGGDFKFCPPVDQDDADNEEGDGSGEEVGGRYAVWHDLRLSSVTDGHIRIGVKSRSCACFDDGIGVVAVKH